ncbi:MULTISPECIES: YlxQ family RNA-binding protein [Aeribacillus]|jgi:ribosomal protein L7Ae-like RNA K-turn-binding protein|uniref:50S ribosomal protein L7 n=1 Tax=Aeribacillus pallidus TaxID=33936 RepID=A0A223E8J7_9BACI|nr:MULTISPECIES: YlxQ family RNA-binding protein [Aeribacillus]ASS91520.1 50S ribosomal protein L7 [Aeribacillus pallidus]MED0714421.1 YlxQ family RNA-binding protein [Aeribacillus composti]MED0744690.1 YlxQ family RNA-binding protein [Aeribacillus composti]MED1437458.1 YlxQ family RNA-binding protein [Aeribacillus composti]
MNGQWKSLLGLAYRARKVISGEELVLKEVRNKRAKLVLLADDASSNTKKKITDKCTFYKVPLVIAPNRYELGQSIGKEERVVVAVTEEGFAKKLRLLLE